MNKLTKGKKEMTEELLTSHDWSVRLYEELKRLKVSVPRYKDIGFEYYDDGKDNFLFFGLTAFGDYGKIYKTTMSPETFFNLSDEGKKSFAKLILNMV
jgi:hypothetical protein